MLQSTGLQKVGHDLAIESFIWFAFSFSALFPFLLILLFNHVEQKSTLDKKVFSILYYFHFIPLTPNSLEATNFIFSPLQVSLWIGWQIYVCFLIFPFDTIGRLYIGSFAVWLFLLRMSLGIHSVSVHR